MSNLWDFLDDAVDEMDKCMKRECYGTREVNLDVTKEVERKRIRRVVEDIDVRERGIGGWKRGGTKMHRRMCYIGDVRA